MTEHNDEIPICPENRDCSLCATRETCPALQVIPTSFHHARKTGFNHWRAKQRNNLPRR